MLFGMLFGIDGQGHICPLMHNSSVERVHSLFSEAFVPLCALGVLLVAVSAAAYLDVRYQRIPNWLTMPLIVLGLGLNGFGRGGEGLVDAGTGFVVGFGALGCLALLSGMGMGDVKLMGGVGAVVGFPHIVSVLLLTAIAGGVEGLVVTIWTGRLGVVLKRLPIVLRLRSAGSGEGSGSAGEPILIPYGVAITAGTLWSLAYL